ncbi:MAG: glutamate synthase large subunit [Verrucomicrobiota bacterium]
MMNKYYQTSINSEGSLHRPELERDACGVGIVAQIQGKASNEILQLGVTAVSNVTHRGALDADNKTGDGAGVTTQIPAKIFLAEAEKLGCKLNDISELAVGVVFLCEGAAGDRLKGKILFEGVLRNRGISVIGWRKVPLNVGALGDKARSTLPDIHHVLLKRPQGMDGDAFERALFLARREIEIKANKEDIENIYIASLSSRLMAYKGFMAANALPAFFLDLQNPDFETAICLYHQRFSTNTFPTWALAQPFRMLAHNGEINTLKGNRNWFGSRVADFDSEVWGEDIKLLKGLIDPDGSDSASLDNAFEALVLSGRSIPHAMAMLVPAAWRIDPSANEEVTAFYKYHRCFSEPWDGPAALAYTDGKNIAASLDRNGLRPARYKITEDGIFCLGSEFGSERLDDSRVIEKGRLGPGQMIYVDLEKGEVVRDKELKQRLASQQPYGQWLKDNRIEFDELVDTQPEEPSGDLDLLTVSQNQVASGYNKEELDMVLSPMLKTAMEATYSMGDDASLSVLSLRPKLLYTYFKQLFAQVTNPPIDPIRERLVMSIAMDLGPEHNLLTETPEHAHVIHLETPFLFTEQLEKLKTLHADYPVKTIDTTWLVSEGQAGMAVALERVCSEAEAAIDAGAKVLVLSDRAISHERVALPTLIATGGVHHFLNRQHKRMLTSLVIDTAEARDTHQMACLLGFGATAICPWLAQETVRELIENDRKKTFEGISVTDALVNYRTALEKGVLKIMSKMGISVLNSYQGAQIFEAIGLGDKVMDRCFSGTPSQVAGIGFEEIAAESLQRHKDAFAQAVPGEETETPIKLGDPGNYRYRRNGERHAVNGPVVKSFHNFVKTGEQEDYNAYLGDLKENKPLALHDMFGLVPKAKGPIPIDQVEPAEDIRRRFTTAAMSMGAISPEAHEVLAMAMNAIGGKSDSGEGGEDFARFGTNKNSKIKQIASGRFGVSAEYLASAEELEIKMAQGAKPGEGGQLPGFKVNGLIAKLRNTQPGVTLISPPPHHDIYSIEDLAQLIHDLKEVNPRARITVKLVSVTGVGTIAAGVAKANADIILISGYDGGTGASPLSSIKNAGMPWEIGLAETQQVLMLNGLRDRVTLRTDGGMRNGMDIMHAAILGAEEFNFGTIALMAMGCVMVRRCHLNTCPVGIATQDSKLRGKFKGSVENVINFFNAVAQEVREHLASIGARSLDEVIGRPEFLEQLEVPGHPKANSVDFSKLLHDVNADTEEELPRICRFERNDGLHERPLDDKIIQDAIPALRSKQKIELSYKIKNTHRNVGTKLSGDIAYHQGNHGLPKGTLDITLTGSAGQSFGTFLVSGVRLRLLGEANDYVGKGMCGGEIIVRPADKAHEDFVAEKNSIIGNTCLYGATGGNLYARGRAGERFCVRNSGGIAVVEGCGDHGCEYMTNGVAVILGSTGKNFGAGMSGGTAYVLDSKDRFASRHNTEMTEAVALTDEADITALKELIYQHLEYTDSERARDILAKWDEYQTQFVKVQAKSDVGVKIKDDEEQEVAAAASK